MTLTLTDLFCGAGGSSTGAIAVPGVRVRIASNHWDLAVETHNTNHPGADHLCADLSAVDPRRFPRTDLLWASPECTNHSVAKGRKRADAQPDLFGELLPDAASERSRATMWDVPRFAEAHRYQAVIVENVVDAWHWQPFRAWLMAMDSLGYDLTSDVVTPGLRAVVHHRITDIVAAFDAHDPGILAGVYRCPGECGWSGNEAQWYVHLADALSDAITVRTVDLPS